VYDRGPPPAPPVFTFPAFTLIVDQSPSCPARTPSQRGVT